MESPRKRRRGRPRVNHTEEERKAASAKAWKKYREKTNAYVDLDSFRKKIVLNPDTFQQWRTLKEKTNMNNDDGFARLLMKCFSEHLEEYVSIVDFFRSSGSGTAAVTSQTNSGRHPEVVKVSKDVKEEQPKKRAGRPPELMSVYYVDSKGRKITTKPGPRPHTTIIMTKAPTCTSRTITSSLSDVRPVIPSEDSSNLSPSVRSARLAFSRALAQSFNAMTSPDRTASAKRNLITSSSGETIAAAPIDNGYSPQEDIDEPYDRPSMVVGVPSVDPRHVRDESTLEPSHRLLVGEYTVGYQDGAEERYSSQSSVLYGDEMGYGEEEIQALQNQPEPQTSSHAEALVETNGSSNTISEPDPSLTLEPGRGLEEDSVKLVQPLGKDDAKLVKVPDPSRRSRLNQITGGLLNRLQKGAMSAEPTQD